MNNVAIDTNARTITFTQDELDDQHEAAARDMFDVQYEIFKKWTRRLVDVQGALPIDAIVQVRNDLRTFQVPESLIVALTNRVADDASAWG